MQNKEALFKHLGFTKTEARIYQAGLTRPAVGAGVLSKQTGIKRPTVYHALETLIQKGLVSKKGDGARVVFTMTPPENLERLLDERMREIEEQKKSLAALGPMLVAGMNEHVFGKLDVQHFEGIAGIKLAVEEALYCRSRNWDIIAPRKNFFSQFKKDYADYYLATRSRRGIKSRSLWEKTPHGKKKTPADKHVTQELLDERHPRYLPKAMHGKFKTVLILFDDKALFISSLKQHSAIMITSKELHAFLSAMFEGLWVSSEAFSTQGS